MNDDDNDDNDKDNKNYNNWGEATLDSPTSSLM